MFVCFLNIKTWKHFLIGNQNKNMNLIIRTKRGLSEVAVILGIVGMLFPELLELCFPCFSSQGSLYEAVIDVIDCFPMWSLYPFGYRKEHVIKRWQC